MIRYTTLLKKFCEQGDKTGWTYIDVPAELAQQLKPNTKKSFRVKITLDESSFEGVAMIPKGEGAFIVAINAIMRKVIRKQKGDSVEVTIKIDEKGYTLNADFVGCLEDDPKASKYYYSLPKSHQNYYSKWIDSAKTLETKTKRIINSIIYLSQGLGYGEMIRGIKKEL